MRCTAPHLAGLFRQLLQVDPICRRALSIRQHESGLGHHEFLAELYWIPFQKPKLEVPTMYKAYVRPM